MNWILVKSQLARILGAAAILTVLALKNAHALEPATGEVLLVINGNIEKSNATRNNEPVAEFDREMLESYGLTTLTTSTPWTGEAINEFGGIRMNTLLETLGVDSNFTSLRATAADDYWFELTEIDYEKYPIIVAFSKNGEAMSVRELGPLWIMFPWDEYPELMNEKSKASSVWQLIELTVK